jgi:hypothetical protein
VTALYILLISLNIVAQDNTASPTVSTVVDREAVSSSTPYKLSFFSLASSRVMDFERGGASIGSYNYLGISYKLDKDSQLGFRYVFFYDTAGFRFNSAKRVEENIEHRTDVGDPYLQYSRYRLGQIEGWELAGKANLYFPASRTSRASRTLGVIRLEPSLRRPVGKYSFLNYTAKFDYYFQTQTTYLDEEVPRYNDGTIPERAVRTTREMKLEHYLEFNWSVHKMFSWVPRIGFEENWNYGSAEEHLDSSHTTVLETQLGMELKPSRSLSFVLAMENQTAVANRGGEAVHYGRPNENSWVLLTYASF